MRTLLCLALFAFGCGGASTAAVNVVNGKVRGAAMPKLYAVASVHVAPAGAPSDDLTQIAIELTSDPQFPCDLLFSEHPKAARTLGIVLTHFASKAYSVPTEAGAYAVTSQGAGSLSDGNYGIVGYFETDASCARNKSVDSFSTTGQVTVTKLSTDPGGEIAGSFDAILDTGERVTGSFETRLCSAPAGSSLDGGASFCQ